MRAPGGCALGVCSVRECVHTSVLTCAVEAEASSPKIHHSLMPALGELPSAIPVSTAPLTKAYRLGVMCMCGLSPPPGLSVTSGREEGGPQHPNIVVSGCGRLLFRRALVLPVR